jgi:hypothetical protein
MIDTDKYEGHTPAPWRFGKQEPPLYLRLAIQAGKAKSEDLQLMADAPLLLEEVKRLREENHVLRMVDWEYERVWEWLMENADHTCRKLLLLIEEWKEEDGLVTIDGRTYEKEMVE